MHSRRFHPRAVRRALLALVTPAAVACSGSSSDGGGTTGPTPAISLAIAPSTLSLTQGATGTATVTVTRTSFTDPVALAVTGAPNGTTATFSPTSLTGTTQSSTLTVATGVGTAAGAYTLSVTAGGNGVATQTQTIALTVTAATQTLTVALAGTGTGSVTSAPAGITCGTTCSAPFAQGASVTLTATAATGSTFAGWSGGGCTGTSTCTVAMSAAQTVTATFNTAAPTTSALTVATSGTGTGTVTSSPAGVTCPGTCTASFNNGTSVTLTATAATGSTFTGWTGGGCTGTGTCVVSLSAATTVTAAFSQIAQTFALTVATAGTGTGTVTSSPAGITCPGTCTNSYASGTSVTLTAAPATGSTFAGWSGACTGTAACTVTLSATQSVTATFNGPAGTFSVALAPAAVTVQAGGATGTSTLNITRANGFTGAVAVTTSGAPNGLTVTANPTSATGASSALTVTAASTVAPGSYNVTIAGDATGIAQQTATLAVTVTAAQSFGLSVAPTSVSVQAGGSGTATVNVARNNGFTGAVALTTSGAPNGLTVTANPTSATGATSALSIAATSTTTPGTYTITVAGTGTGVANQSTTFSVVVTAASGGGGGSGGGNVTYDFSQCDPTEVPIWFAVQSGNGAWTRVNAGANSTFSFSVGGTGGVAYVTQGASTAFDLLVFYGTGTEIGQSGNRCGALAATGSKTLTGTVANVGQTETAMVTIGGALTTVIPFQGSAFTLQKVAAGSRDLIATRSAFSASGSTLSKVIIRRGVNYASTIPVLDFGSSEAFDPVQKTVTAVNANGETLFASVSLLTANGAAAAFSTGLGSGNTVPIFGVPASQLLSTDVHQLVLGATPAIANPTSSRLVLNYFHTPTDLTLTLGPALSTPTVTSLATTPYLRLRATLPSQAAYNQLVSAVYTQASHSVNISATANYFGGTPATWTLDIPDLSAAGFNPAWGLSTGTRVDYTVVAAGGNFLSLVGTPPDGTVVQEASFSGSSTSLVRFLRGQGVSIVRRP